MVQENKRKEQKVCRDPCVCLLSKELGDLKRAIGSDENNDAIDR